MTRTLASATVPVLAWILAHSNIGRLTLSSYSLPHTDIYHLVQKPLWEKCKATGETYYPPTYAQDGFTHATADPAKLLGVANHFYKDVKSDWLCLKMTRQTIADAGITLKFEDPSPVGSTPALNASQSGGERFPHIYGGIPPAIVLEERIVRRSADGTYLSIDGLADGPPAASESDSTSPTVRAAVQGLAAIAAVATAVMLVARRR